MDSLRVGDGEGPKLSSLAGSIFLERREPDPQTGTQAASGRE
jgi:hypothetical protein